MYKVLITLLFFISLNASAALVDIGNHTTDTDSGLDWLDLSETSGLGTAAALAANSGWRYAANSEIEALFGVAFDGYYDTQPNGLSLSVDVEYADQAADVTAWENLFGYSSTVNYFWSYGFYQDEDSLWKNIGTRREFGGDTVVVGLENTGDISSLVANGSPSFGTYLVRTTVPVPAAVWLFGSALAGLGWFRRKQYA